MGKLLIHHSNCWVFLEHLVLTLEPGYPKEIRICELVYEINIIENFMIILYY